MKNDPRIASFTQFTKRELGEFTQLSQKSEKKKLGLQRGLNPRPGDTGAMS